MQHINKIPNVTNVGYIDSLVRLVIGIGALTPALLQLSSVGEFSSVLALVSIYPLLTAGLRWDPFYEIVNVRSTHETLISEQVIEDFLERSRLYLMSFTGTAVTRVNNDSVATNDLPSRRKSA